MKSKSKDLQKFTELDSKIIEILALKQITPQDVDTLEKSELPRFLAVLNEKVNSLKGVERATFLTKIESITDNETKNQLWEFNHNHITWAIATLMQEYGRMPSKMEIATKTELTRQTVHKHLKEYMNHPLYIGQIEQFRFMTSKVLAKVFQFAVNGDIGAAKLYFNVMGCLNNGQNSQNILIQNQNNYIQINNTLISQDNLKNLNPEQLAVIENVIKSVLPTQDQGLKS